MRIKKSQEDVKKIVNELGYNLLYDYVGSKTKLIISDNDGFYYQPTLSNLQNNKIPEKFHVSNSYTIQNIKLCLILNNIPLELLSKKYKNNRTKLVFRDKEGYLYFSVLGGIENGKIPERFHKLNPFTMRNIKLWCNLENKPFELLCGQIYEGSIKKLQWLCLKNSCGEIFNANWADIYMGNGCGVCAGRQVRISNCLANVDPILTLEWHPTKNLNLTPFDVTRGSDIEVWWKCKECGHEWEQKIGNRKGCPECDRKNRMGNKNPAWKGGISSESNKIRGSLEYKEWRLAVFVRDKFICQCCGDAKGGNLRAHHIKNFAEYPELRFDINNGITLCDNCHKPNIKNSFHDRSGTRNNNLNQLITYYNDYHGDFKSPFFNSINLKEKKVTNEQAISYVNSPTRS